MTWDLYTITFFARVRFFFCSRHLYKVPVIKNIDDKIYQNLQRAPATPLHET